MYKIRDGVELPETFKIKVTPEQSEALQKHLFSSGVSWASGHKEVRYITSPFLFVSENTLLCANTSEFFTNGTSPEIIFSDYFECENSATDLVLKFLQKHHTKISTEVYAKRGGDDYELEIKAEVKEKGVYTRFVVTLSGKDIGKANTFISTVSAVLGLNPVGLKAYELARENTMLRSDLETARNFNRAYYRLRVQELRKKIYELTKAKTEVKEDFPKKWCIKITKKNRDLLNKYLSDNRSKYVGWTPNWAVSLCSMYFFSESVHKYSHSSIDTLPGFTVIKTKQFKQLLNEKIS
ncbi:MAG: hypothetical protein KA234_00320 [Saprospiraceae bacterium]|nr:hypothetical protein [Saprospiraceae bacterium]